MKIFTRIAVGLFLGLTVSSHADTLIDLTTTDGTVPGTAITYTITDNSPSRSIFPAVGNTDNHTWNWTSGFPEFANAGTDETLTVNFSAPVPIDRIVTGVNSTTYTTSSFSVSGGTASTSDFDLSDGLGIFNGPGKLATYNPSTGAITSSARDVALMIGSTSTNTITSFTLYTPYSDGGLDGYTQFFGLTDVAPAATPEPGAVAFFVAGGFCGLGLLARRRKSRAA